MKIIISYLRLIKGLSFAANPAIFSITSHRATEKKWRVRRSKFRRTHRSERSEYQNSETPKWNTSGPYLYQGGIKKCNFQ